MELYRIDLRIRLTPRHPMFAECRGESLLVWLFSRDPETAGESAARIAELCGYEILSLDQMHTLRAPSIRPELIQAETQAIRVGLSLLLVATPLGPPQIDET
jgi:hypothetical protein